jgi:hypothetical protein
MVLINKKNSRQPRQSRENRPEWEPPYQPDAPLPGLEPVGGGFYATSGEPVSPYDCDRWPDAPFCGGFPFTEQPVGFNFSFVLDECNIGIQSAPVFGFVKLPASQLVYRFPGKCRLPVDPPRKPPERNEELPTIPPPNYCGDSRGFLGLILMKKRVVNRKYFTYNVHEYIGEENETTEVTLIRASKPENQYIYDKYLKQNLLIIADITLGVNDYYLNSFEDIEYSRYHEKRFAITSTGRGYGDYVGNYLRFAVNQELGRVYYNYEDFIEGCNRWKSFYSYDDQGSAQYENMEFRVPYVICGSFESSPPPPQDRNCRCMCCDDSLLKLLLSRVNKIYKTVGVDDYPVNAPQWITKDNSPQIQIANLTRFISYTIKQLDAISGNYPIKIKIQDSDLTQEGDQEKTVSVPNAAEGIAEILGLLLAVRTEVSATLAAAVNGMVEAGSSKQTAFLAYEYAKANAEYLAYKGKQVERELPFSFKPNEQRLDKMMEPTTMKVKGWDNDDKNDITDAFAPLLELAAMWKAQNFRNLGAQSPIEKLRTIMKGAGDIPSNMGDFRKYPPNTEPQDEEQQPQKDEWDVFLDEAEEGFIAQPGITDNKNPYGRPREQRPRVREIGTDTSDIDEGEGEE